MPGLMEEVLHCLKTKKIHFANYKGDKCYIISLVDLESVIPRVATDFSVTD